MANENKKKFALIGERVVARTERAVRSVSLEIHANLVEDTPVDTGWARSNWTAQLGKPREDVVGAPGRVENTGVDQAPKIISTWKSGVTGPINITNNVPYIGRLNAGSSTQSPAGFVEKAVQRATNKFGG